MIKNPRRKRSDWYKAVRDAGREAAVAMIQFHGAIGFTAPHPAHLFFKRAKRQEYEFGGTIYHRDRVANHWIKTAPDRP